MNWKSCAAAATYSATVDIRMRMPSSSIKALDRGGLSVRAAHGRTGTV